MNPLSPFEQRVRFCANNLVEIGEDAITGLVDLTARRLVRFAVTVTRNQHDAEDAVQAVLVKLASDPECLAGAARPWSYLLRMVRNEALAIARRTKRWNLSDGILDLRTQCPVDELEREETYRAVWLALRKLPGSQSEVVVLKIWEGFTFAQIAEVLQVTPSTVASRYRYAMSKLAVLLTQNTDGEQQHV